jgi:hypothetical protein
LLNVFLAIAVDNLATAQEMTAEQEEAEALAKEQKEKSAAKEANMFLPPQSANITTNPKFVFIFFIRVVYFKIEI